MNQTYQTPNLDVSWEQLRQTIQQQADLIRSFQQECRCHVIDTNKNKVNILMWADKNALQFKAKCPGCACHAQSFIQKIANQKFIGLIRTDKHRAVYWKFRNLVEETHQVKETKKAEVKANLIKCWECKEEVEIIGELDESAPLVCSDCEKKKAEAQKQSPETNPEVKETKENVNNQQN